MMQENGLGMKQVQKIASRRIREMENPSHENSLCTHLNKQVQTNVSLSWPHTVPKSTWPELNQY